MTADVEVAPRRSPLTTLRPKTVSRRNVLSPRTIVLNLPGFRAIQNSGGARAHVSEDYGYANTKRRRRAGISHGEVKVVHSLRDFRVGLGNYDLGLIVNGGDMAVKSREGVPRGKRRVQRKCLIRYIM